MSKAALKYEYISLEGMTTIQRKHERDIQPPGMTLLSNGVVSMSDKMISLRPDVDRISEAIPAFSLNLSSAPSSVSDNLNYVSGIYGSDNLVWFTSYAPFSTVASGSPQIISGTYTTGTASGTTGGVDITGSGTSWLTKAYRGQLIEFDADGTYYVIDSVSSDTTLKLTSALESDYSGVSYKIYYNHNPFMSAYSLNIQNYLGEMVYGNPNNTDDLSVENICGPFHSLASETYGVYSGFCYVDSVVAPGWGVDWSKQPNLCYTGTQYMAIGFNHIGGYITTSSISQDDQWTHSSTFTDYPYSIIGEYAITYDQDQIMITCLNDLTGFHYSTGVAVSADDGSTWSAVDCTNYDDTDHVCISAAYNGSRYALVIYTISTGAISCIYTDDDGGTWGAYTGEPATGSYRSKIKYLDSQFILVNDDAIYYTGSATGTSFTKSSVGSETQYVNDVVYTGDKWIAAVGNIEAVGDHTNTFYYADGLTTGWTETDSTILNMGGKGGAAHLTYDSETGRILCPFGKYNTNYLLYYWSEDDGVTWSQETIDCSVQIAAGGGVDEPTNFASTSYGTSAALTFDGGAADLTTVVIVPDHVTEFTQADYLPISDIYRSTCFSILDGYVVLFSTREYADGSWSYNPRRVRWTSPGTVDDFDSDGSGFGDVLGTGSFIDARTVNGRIVTFETDKVGALVPRGIVTDPWDYDILQDGFTFVSNPEVVGDMCYIVGSDGLLYQTDGVSFKETGSSFDLTEYDDYNPEKPIWLGYSTKIKALLAYQTDADASFTYCHVINVQTGGVSQIKLQPITVSTEPVRSVVPCRYSVDQRVFVSYFPETDTNTIINGELSFGDPITGLDNPYTGADYDKYFVGDYQSGRIYPNGEGNKVSLRHGILETYNDGEDSDYTPDIIIGVQSNEDSDWLYQGDQTGTFSYTNGSNVITGTGTAWSNTIADGDDVEDTFTLPWQATQCEIYVDSTKQTLGTDYTITDTKEITLASPLASGTVLYAYSNNYPHVKVKVGDYFLHNFLWHRVVSIESATSLTTDKNSTVTGTGGTHYTSHQMDAGTGYVKFGINRLVEGVKFRFITIPINDSSAPSVVKLTGLSIGYVEAGRKTLEASGS